MSTVFKKIACVQEKIGRPMNFASGSVEKKFWASGVSRLLPVVANRCETCQPYLGLFVFAILGLH